MVVHPCGPAVFVGPEQADVEVVARELEVVGVAAEERDLLLRCEYQPHIGVLLGAIEVICSPLPESHHVAPQARRCERLLFDLGHHRPAGSKRLIGRHRHRDGRLHPIGDILDGAEHVELEVMAFQLLRPRRRREAAGK